MRCCIASLLLMLAGQAFAFPSSDDGEGIRGAELMTPGERKAHVARLQEMRSFDECRSYMRAHYLDLEKRAQERHVILPPVQSDPCEVMRLMGRLK